MSEMSNARSLKHTIYVALGVNLEGRKELLGLWLEETEGAKFWLSCLTDLKNRGLRHLRGVHRRTDRFRRSDPGGLSADERAAVHRALVRAALRYVSRQGQQGGRARPEEDLPVGDGARGGAGAGRVRSRVGREVSDD
jgi:hypothetical protein